MLEIGDKARIRTDITEDTECIVGVITEMLQFRGNIVTIRSIFKDADGVSYVVDENTWFWDDVLLEPIK